MVGFDVDISNKSILILSDATDVKLSIVTIIYQLNENPLLHGDDNFLLPIKQRCKFGVDFHYDEKFHGGKHYIHDRYSLIPMKFYKYLMYMPIQEPAQLETYNLNIILFT